jgi:hypothetical protein
MTTLLIASYAIYPADPGVTIGPYTHEVSQVLRLRNPNREPVAFKVSLLQSETGTIMHWVTKAVIRSKPLRLSSKHLIA